MCPQLAPIALDVFDMKIKLLTYCRGTGNITLIKLGDSIYPLGKGGGVLWEFLGGDVSLGPYTTASSAEFCYPVLE